MAKVVDKRVTLQLGGLDGNAFALLAAWRRQARQEGWSSEEIDAVIKEAMAGDYNHLLNTLIDHTRASDEDSNAY